MDTKIPGARSLGQINLIWLHLVCYKASVKLSSFHHSGAYNFEKFPTFLTNVTMPDVKHSELEHTELSRYFVYGADASLLC